MDSEEITYWKVIDEKFDPIGEWRKDFRMGSAVAPILNLLRSFLQSNPQYVSASDFVLDMRKKPVAPEQQSMEEMKNILRALADQGKKKKTPSRLVVNTNTGVRLGR